ncbi:hypothetical protein B7Y94_00855 [Candidatus Saccharibacteria bacterium 32-49-12]|nr:MAG: hypothetical protein B7Y94_00855 [Candidatus Saccharibacteria bacterium 32-49-12]
MSDTIFHMEKRDFTKVAVGSQNRAKLSAIEQVFGKVFEGVEINGYDVESGVSAQPMTDEESIEGAKNRATAAIDQDENADYGVGLEGNVAVVADRMFLHGWVAVVDRSGTVGLGHSGGLELPDSIRQQLESGKELGPVLQEMLGDEDNEIRHSAGTNGVLSGELYTRVDEFVHAASCALAKFIKPELYR